MKRIDVGVLCVCEGFYGVYVEDVDMYELDEDVLLDCMEDLFEGYVV